MENQELYQKIATAIENNDFLNIQDDIIKLTDITKSLEENVKDKDTIIKSKDDEIKRLTDDLTKTRLRVSELYLKQARDIDNIEKENVKNNEVDLTSIIESEE